MERGLLWLPLLALFSWLAWAGWNEYQKVEAYSRWASEFERAKYDIYAVLGQRGDQLVWGKPTRQGPVEVASVTLAEVAGVALTLGGEPVELVELPAAAPKPSRGRPEIVFTLHSGETRRVPFTDRELAERWYRFLAARAAGRDRL